MINEVWKDVPGYEGIYQIDISTKEGRCRRIYKNGKTKELANTPDSRDGRIFWHLSNGNKGVSYQAARWIALTYPELVQGEYFEGAEIDHIDTDRRNNHPSNLRWTTHRGNMNNENTRATLTNHPDNSNRVWQYTLNGEYVNDYPSAEEAKRQTGIHHICDCCNYKRKTAGGFKWAYKE